MSADGSHLGAGPVPLGNEIASTASFELPSDGLAPAMARRAVEQLLLTRWYIQDQRLLDDVLLSTSELVTNAVRYGGEDVTLRLALRPDAIEISVEDGSTLLPTAPSRLADNPYREGGRGLTIVRALASDWGVEQRPPASKRIWARLSRTARA